MDRVEAFTKIYRENGFGGKESKSGSGSDLKNTETLRARLIQLLNEMRVTTLIDGPCGDLNWMQHVLPFTTVKQYIGVDIVSELIEKNKKTFPELNFRCLDLAESLFGPGDLMLCRDCLVHLSFRTTLKVLRNFVSSGIDNLLTTTFLNDDRRNMDFADGTSWYLISLMKPPFNFPKPKVLLNEGCAEGGGAYSDKSLGLWSREEVEVVCGNLERYLR